ncbi:MAG: ABC transporter ATP-binding protein [Deltaproteobacteria bacterium]|nr:ABC transporter ATP-binding protein [Deltaproteobacteria bacterium]
MDDAIVVEGLVKTFRTPLRRRKVEAVRSVSFRVGRGEIFGFLGPNGAGKTTTIKVLVGLVRPTAGRVTVLGGAPDDMGVKRRLGFLPEQPYFYDYLKPTELLDVFGALFGMSRAERRRVIPDLLDRVGLGAAKDRAIRKFSKGMQQRVGIAQALLNDPDLVILDEPMSGLDPIGRREVIDLIASLKARGKTVFFSSHILADVERLADRVVILDRGVMKASGTLPELLGQGTDEREVVLRAAPGSPDPASLPGVSRVEALSPGLVRAICPAGRSDPVLAAALAAGFAVVSVAERRMTLEELVVSHAAGAGPGGIGAGGTAGGAS